MDKVILIDTPQPATRFKLSPLIISLLLAVSNNSIAEQSAPLQSKEQLELERQNKVILEQGEAIKRLKKRLDRLQKNDQKKGPKPQQKNNKEAAQRSVKPVGQAPAKEATPINVPALPKSSTSVGGILTKPGSLVIEPSIVYSFTDNNRVFLEGYSFIPSLVVGIIDIREVKRHSFIAGLTARYGLSNRSEFDLKIPLVGRNDSQRSRPISESVSEDLTFDASGSDIGDIEFSTRYQLNTALDGGPIYVANLAITIPTGTSPFDVEFVETGAGITFPTELPTGSGYVSIQPSISAVYPTDPGVFFGNINFGFNADTDEEVGNVDAGDNIGVSFGLGVSLNERTSFNISYSHKHVLKSKINNEKVKGSDLDIGQLLIGYSFRYSQTTNFNLSLGIGTTEDAQDIKIGFRMPVLMF